MHYPKCYLHSLLDVWTVNQTLLKFRPILIVLNHYLADGDSCDYGKSG